MCVVVDAGVSVDVDDENNKNNSDAMYDMGDAIVPM